MPAAEESAAEDLRLCLAGDLMAGRGLDQILPHPLDPAIREVRRRRYSALDYVALAEAANGPVPRPVGFDYPWGDALPLLRHRPFDLLLANLETAITRQQQGADKAIRFRLSPANAGLLAAAGLDACALANNHALDYGHEGLLETLATLQALGIGAAGAGRSLAEAEAPAILPVAGKGRLLFFSRGLPTSGIPAAWTARAQRPGVARLPDLSLATTERLIAQLCRARQPGDRVVLSLHWGDNWTYEVSRATRRFAQRLVAAGAVDLLHGHSSHHPKAIEVHRGRAILYGCGECLNDYEGTARRAGFHHDLVLLYGAALMPSGALRTLDLMPYRIRRMRLTTATAAERAILAGVIDRQGQRFGTRAIARGDRALRVTWRAPPPTQLSVRLQLGERLEPSPEQAP